MKGLLALALASALSVPAADEAAKPALSVFNFRMRSGSATWQWLEKGIADRLITDITLLGRTQPIQRDVMQALAEEIHWAPELMSEPGRLDMLTKSARIGTVISGVYDVDGKRIRISASAVDLRKQAEVARFDADGELSDALGVMRTLSERVLRWVATGDGGTVAAAMPAWTRSVDAARSFYEGMDLYDKGFHQEAWIRFRQASARDKEYAEARYWMGRMYCLMHRYGHAMLSLREFIYEDSGQNVRKGDAIKDYVHCWEYSGVSADRLIEVYTDLLRRFPDVAIPQEMRMRNVPAAAWLGCKIALAEQERGRMQEAVKAAQDALKACEGTWARNIARGVMREIACRLREYTGAAPEGSLAFSVVDHYNRPIESRKATLQGNREALRIMEPKPLRCLGSSHRDDGKMSYHWVNVPYTVSAPAGFVITSLECRLIAKGGPGIAHAFLSREKLGDLGTAQKDATPAIKDGFSFPTLARTTGVDLELSLRGKDWWTDPEWEFQGAEFVATVEPMGPIGAVEVRCASLSDHVVSADGAPCRVGDGAVGMLKPGMHEIRVEPIADDSPFTPWTTNLMVTTGAAAAVDCVLPWKNEPRWTQWVSACARAPKGVGAQLQMSWNNWPAIVTDDDAVRVVWVRNADLWCSTSSNGLTFQKTERIVAPVSSGVCEMGPSLARDHRGRYVLSFLSTRGQTRKPLPYVCWSRDFSMWSTPVPASSDATWAHSIAVDRNGQCVMACIGEDWDTEVQILVSDDAYRWRKLTVMKSPLPVSNLVLAQPPDAPLTLYLWSIREDKYPARDVEIHRYESNDGERWSRAANDSFGKLGFPRGNFGVAYVGKQPVLATFERRSWGGKNKVGVENRTSRLRRHDGKAWRDVFSVAGLTTPSGAIAYHPKWGLLVVWASTPLHKETAWLADTMMESSSFLEGNLYMIRRSAPPWQEENRAPASVTPAPAGNRP